MLQIATTWDQPNYWVPGGVMLTMLGFLFAVVFECQNPFWDSALWYAFGIFDIVSDIYSITVVMMVSKDLNLRTDSKIKLLVILGSKFLPVACAIARLPFIHAAYTSENYTIALYRLSMPTQIQLHLSVVSLSLGRIFRFLAALDVGYLASSIEPTTAKGSRSRSQTARYGTYGKASKNQISQLSQKRSISDHESSKGLVLGREWNRLDGDIPLESQQSNTQISAQWTPKSADAATIGEREIRVTKTIEVTRT
ncbi:hypothetical protein LTR05_005836 [Lithohypha guttulata]|uniref:Rhodopsin domain-containing protein n=1 Tax=Lithohypha guttulata TaxID=1690604 RepID=A0AAN7SZW8_9EURO|nr:hypothetical protein LTR05_005836 [Lithohypha guttulata]